MAWAIPYVMTELYDYHSPNLPFLNPLDDFPNIVPEIGQRLLNLAGGRVWHDPHRWYHSRESLVGSVNMDEGHLLYGNALQFKGKPAIEIGSLFGFSAWFLLMAGVELHLCDPRYTESMERAALEKSLDRFDHWDMTANPSPAGAIELGRKYGTWALAFVDGQHDEPYPLIDTVAVLHDMADDAMIIFHDMCYGGPQRAMHYLQGMGWQGRIYHTSQMLAVCWRGQVEPFRHIPDKALLNDTRGFPKELFF